MQVHEIMNRQPATLTPNATLADALEEMAAQKARHVVVLENDKVRGILSDRDLAMYYDPEQMTADRWRQATVADLMTPDPVSIGSQAATSEAAKLLLKTAVSALPVIDGGKLVGIISEKDFVRHAASNG